MSSSWVHLVISVAAGPVRCGRHSGKTPAGGCGYRELKEKPLDLGACRCPESQAHATSARTCSAPTARTRNHGSETRPGSDREAIATGLRLLIDQIGTLI